MRGSSEIAFSAPITVDHPDVDSHWIIPSCDVVERASRNRDGTYNIDLARYSRRRDRVCPVERHVEYMDPDGTFERLRRS